MSKNIIKPIVALMLTIGLFFMKSNIVLAEDYTISQENNSLIVVSNLEGDHRLGVEFDGEFTNYELRKGKNEIALKGVGIHKLMILEKKKGNKYRILNREVVDVEELDKVEMYLQANEKVDWRESTAIINKAKELTNNVESDKEKVKTIYKYIVENVRYDNEKAIEVKAGYLPNLDSILMLEKGICCDYASLFSGMLRSIGIPTKYITGDCEDIEVYHAWNEVYLDGEWFTIDTTYDSTYNSKGIKLDMFKNEDKYKTKYIY